MLVHVLAKMISTSRLHELQDLANLKIMSEQSQSMIFVQTRRMPRQ